LSDPGHAFLNFKYLAIVSQAGVAGWSQDFISPLALLGLPWPTQVIGRVSQLYQGVGYAILILIVGGMLAREPVKFSTIGKTFYTLAALSYVFYLSYFFLVGPSYQQWKLASYLPLATSFAVIGALLKMAVSSTETGGSFARTSVWQVPAVLATCASLILANVAVHYKSESPPEKFFSNYANLKELESLASVKNLFMEMGSYSATFFPVYFIRNKVLHLISPSYYPQEVLKPEDISPQTPLFLEGDVCEQDKYRVPLRDLGCLFLRLPTLKLDSRYRFSQNLIEFTNVQGLSTREAWGRWSDGNEVIVPLSVDGEDLEKHPIGFINFHVSPFLPTGRSAQNVLISWGHGRSGHAVVSEGEWVSLPINEQDWEGSTLKKIAIKFDLPDAISPHKLDAANLDTRKLGIGFVSLSWTMIAAGDVPIKN
jgi:hypothetical protein